MNKLLFIAFFLLGLIACQPSKSDANTTTSVNTDVQSANMLISEIRNLTNHGQWQQARLLLDSLHTTYPKQLDQRRIANTLEDSITYLEALQTVLYVDSTLPPLLEQVDILLKRFKYEKNEQYEDHGKYVHRILATNSNTSRNFIQAYVLDSKKTIVKSYYFGSYQVNQQTLNVQADGEGNTFHGSNYHFNQDKNHHEIMTLNEEDALALLNFISTHYNSRVRVEGIGDKTTRNWVYYLNDKEKEALSETYQLGWLMKDINRLEQMKNAANVHINRYIQ